MVRNKFVDLSTNTAVKTFKYDSFGNITGETGDFPLPFRFAGGIYDEHTKLTRFGVREFRRNQRSCHFYVYAHNDGVNFSYADSCRMVDLDGRKLDLTQHTLIKKRGVDVY